MKARLQIQLIIATAVCWAAAAIVALWLALAGNIADENAQELAIVLAVFLFSFPIVLALAYFIITADPTGDDYKAPERHIEIIECPDCKCRCEATVLRTRPWYVYVHECEHCGKLITENEWKAASPNATLQGRVDRRLKTDWLGDGQQRSHEE